MIEGFFAIVGGPGEKQRASAEPGGGDSGAGAALAIRHLDGFGPAAGIEVREVVFPIPAPAGIARIGSGGGPASAPAFPARLAAEPDGALGIREDVRLISVSLRQRGFERRFGGLPDSKGSVWL